MAHPDQVRETRACKIRECFQQWDSDGNGYITKAELHAVLLKLVPAGATLTKDDIDRLMVEADRNHNGRIEYQEFVDWLTRPAASLYAASERIELFDLPRLLKPLFNVYDRNGDGTISFEEFDECHNILQTALTVHPAQGDQMQDPDALVDHAKPLFQKVDSNDDQRVSFEEFVQWQQEAMERSGLLNEDLAELVPALTRQLQRIFKLSESNEKGELMKNDQNVLLHITKNVANFARDLWNDEEVGHSSIRGKHHYTNRWSEPPVGLNISRLKGVHLKLIPVRTWGVENIDLEITCIPEADLKDPRQRHWFARVVRSATYRSGRQERDEPCYYVYANLNWMPDQALADEFGKALTSLPPELRIFCLLKTEANFGVEISWDQIQAGLGRAVELGLLMESHVRRYNEHTRGLVREVIRKHGTAGHVPEEKVEGLCARAAQAPRNVMATLAELRVLQVSSVWADVLQA